MTRSPQIGTTPLLFPTTEPDARLYTSRIAGSKAAALLTLSGMGAPVPPGFVLPTALMGAQACSDGQMPVALAAALAEGLKSLESQGGRRLGDPNDPLLVSLRFSSPIALPWTPRTVLNLGLTPAGVPALARRLGDPAAAWNALARLVRGHARQVMELSEEGFDELQEAALEREGVESPHELSPPAIEALTKGYLELYQQLAGRPLPDQPLEQIHSATLAFLRFWNSPVCSDYRWEHGLDDTEGPALIVQSTVYGTGPKASGTGRMVTRMPSTGEKKPHGQYLPQAQGPDLTAGIRMTEPIGALKSHSPEAYGSLLEWGKTLEQKYRDAVELRFTVENGALWLLDCRPAQRTPKASLRMALDLHGEGICDEARALTLVQPLVVEEYMHPVLDTSTSPPLLTKGLPASPGSAVGQVVFFAEHAVELAARGIKTILVRHETTPEDIDGLKVAEGIITMHGGLTSHAAVVARGMGKCCIVSASEITINYLINEMTVGERTVNKQDWISMNGTSGEIYLGQLPQVQPPLNDDLATVLEWADKHRTLGVYANADTPVDASKAVEMGAGGIGLCRTEHMFFPIDRIPAFRKMILANNKTSRTAALAELMPLQRKDFLELFRVMQGRPVTIRLLDPPLNEFLPRGIRSQSRMAKAMGIPVEEVQKRTEHLTENNPMMGHRGCRLAVTYPEIYAMQVRAIVEAACIVKKEGVDVKPEIMVPLVSTPGELRLLRQEIQTLIDQVFIELGETVGIRIGTMIETPRAAMNSRAIAHWADFYSFGTNDLTQMGYGFSRDDAGMFLPTYLEKGILKEDPFVQLDQHGIGHMVQIAVTEGRKGNTGLKIGICGEHGGDPESVKFCHRLGLDYVSCSPFRIPVARLAAGQAAVAQRESAHD